MSLSKNQSLDDNKTSECTVFIRHKFLLSMLIYVVFPIAYAKRLLSEYM